MILIGLCQQLAATFEQKSSGIAPAAANTDMFGGLWRMKILFESSQETAASAPTSKTIWIFSDMMNETQAFPMPQLLELGPVQMLDRAKASRLTVPMCGFKVHIYGASPIGLSPQSWLTMKTFWEILRFRWCGTRFVFTGMRFSTINHWFYPSRISPPDLRHNRLLVVRDVRISGSIDVRETCARRCRRSGTLCLN